MILLKLTCQCYHHYHHNNHHHNHLRIHYHNLPSSITANAFV